MAYQLQEINRRIQTDVHEFLAECDDNYAQRVSLAADKILMEISIGVGRAVGGDQQLCPIKIGGVDRDQLDLDGPLAQA